MFETVFIIKGRAIEYLISLGGKSRSDYGVLKEKNFKTSIKVCLCIY